ncbi:hypothetical protein Mal4_36730 [Maioricimonas rarisocia]|uniref:Uncharacterized protein n=1 Tax=Maioricimonas rarisocia TaxID=2528026 RepID=A0A517ZA16_9PLAN|nr:hypothetical protein [Maioricimonas rarisocia]QDU39332.1 hypothetical protein Mal4_36730 [Maioricimonas rarisocia]
MSEPLECAWCDSQATRSVNYRTFDLAFPICADDRCKLGLDQFMSSSAFLLTADIAGATRDPQLAQRLNKLRNYVSMQR